MIARRLHQSFAGFAIAIFLATMVMLRAPALAHPLLDATPLPPDFRDPMVLNKGACALDPRNLVTNGSMAPPLHNIKYGIIVDGWEPVIFSGSNAPDYHWADVEQNDPNGSQQISFSQPFDAGLHQTVRHLTPGVYYWLRVGYFVAARSIDSPEIDTATIVRQIGVDPTGGTDPDSPNVVWGQPVAPYKRVALNHPNMILLFAARADRATIYIRAIAREATVGENRVWIDSICMEPRLDRATALPPGVSPTSTSSVTASPTNVPTPSATPTPTRTSTPSPTPTPTPTATNTPSPTFTVTPTATPPVLLIGGMANQGWLTNLGFLFAGILIGIAGTLLVQSWSRAFTRSPVAPETLGVNPLKSANPRVVGIVLISLIAILLALAVAIVSLTARAEITDILLGTSTPTESATATSTIAPFVPSATPTLTETPALTPPPSETATATSAHTLTDTPKPAGTNTSTITATLPITLIVPPRPTGAPTNTITATVTITSAFVLFPGQTYNVPPILSRAMTRPSAQPADLSLAVCGSVVTESALRFPNLRPTIASASCVRSFRGWMTRDAATFFPCVRVDPWL